ncbi:MAG: peptidyl-tRNA hydrolase [Planctomycetes bacterium]|nr:peptidyl-tRNA hydrolase [Planctomycetota bacterium]
MTRIVVGLGNPGPEYERTRHNVGFLVLDRLARQEGLLFRTARNLKDACEGDPVLGARPPYSGPKKFRFARSLDPDALWVKPETFMNLSGEVVAPLVRWAGAEPHDLMVVYDDLDLEPGVLRLRPWGGAGGQRGMRSIIDSLGTDRFPRLRVGIGRPRTDAARHVLEEFSEKELPDLEVTLAEAGEAVLDWLHSGDIEKCMTRFHSRWNQGD